MAAPAAALYAATLCNAAPPAVDASLPFSGTAVTCAWYKETSQIAATVQRLLFVMPEPCPHDETATSSYIFKARADARHPYCVYADAILICHQFGLGNRRAHPAALLRCRMLLKHCYAHAQSTADAKATRLEAGVQPAIAVGSGDDGRELLLRTRVVQARILQIVCNALEALYT